MNNEYKKVGTLEKVNREHREGVIVVVKEKSREGPKDQYVLRSLNRTYQRQDLDLIE